MQKSAILLLFTFSAFGAALDCYQCSSSLEDDYCLHPQDPQTSITHCDDLGTTELGYECVSFRVSNNADTINNFTGVSRACLAVRTSVSTCDLVKLLFSEADVNCVSCNEDLCNNVEV